MDAPTACRRTVSGTISLPYYGCFSPFPHGTGTLSVSGEYLALADGPAGFTQGSTCPALLGILLHSANATRKGLSPAAAPLSRGFRSHSRYDNAVPQPPSGRNLTGLGYSPVARRYQGNHILFSSPPGTKMFQFPGFASPDNGDTGASHRWVAPFGHPRVTGRLHLTAAFRSLPRPSSPS